MKKWMMWSSLCLLVLATLGWSQDVKPTAVSPGLDGAVAVVSLSSPTFSWSAVPGAKGYRLVVFKFDGKNILPLEAMENTGIAVASKDIPAAATSWTPSENEKLANGSYIWYVRALDPIGGGLWSDGRPFSIDSALMFLAGEEAAKDRQRSRNQNGGTTSNPMANSFNFVNPPVKTAFTMNYEPTTPNGSSNPGSEGPTNTLYGNLAGGGITSGMYNSFFGAQAGKVHTSAPSGAYFGYGAGMSNTTGRYNTFIGSVAGQDNTTGEQNTFVGNGAGFHNTTGSSNTLIGELAGSFALTASNNTIVGSYAGSNSTTGYSNSIFGANAGNFNTTGYYNAFFGAEAGYSNTIGYNNAFFGRSSGYANTEGFRNTFIGYGSGMANTTGNRNAFLGYYSGVNNSIGFANTFFGDATGGKNTTGYRNTFIGYGAGNSNITGNSNVCIGSYAGFYETGSNRLYIDVVDTVYPLIYGEFDNRLASIFGNFGVGVLATTYPIQVTGGAYCTGTTWVDASSRSLKENIVELGAEEAQQAFENLSPVKFSYKTDPEKTQVGFIAEDAPSLVATKDRKGMSPMDVVAVLTKVVQEQQKSLAEQQRINAELRERLARLEKQK